MTGRNGHDCLSLKTLTITALCVGWIVGLPVLDRSRGATEPCASEVRESLSARQESFTNHIQPLKLNVDGERAADFYPCRVAAKYGVTDAGVWSLLHDLDARLGSSVVAPEIRESFVEHCPSILDSSNLSALQTIKLTCAVDDLVGTYESSDQNVWLTLIKSRFTSEAFKRAKREFDSRPVPAAKVGTKSDIFPDPSTNIIPTLRTLTSLLGDDRRLPELCQCYGMLSVLEEDKSTFQYRARLKFSDLQFITGAPSQALQTLNDLIRDVRAGWYSEANYRELAILKWDICNSIGRRLEGIEFIREARTRDTDKRNAPRLTSLLVRALLQNDNVTDAEMVLSTAKSTSGEVSQPESDNLIGLIALKRRELGQRHLGPATAP